VAARLAGSRLASRVPASRWARAAREVLLGVDPPVALTQRAKRILADVRDEHVPTVHPAGSVIVRTGTDVRWWTWAGYRANATLARPCLA